MKKISKKKYKKAKQIVKLYKKQKSKLFKLTPLTDKEKLMYEIDDFEINNQVCAIK